MGTLGINSYQARQQCIRCWTSWGRRALSWDNLIITLLPVFFKSFFSEDQASCLVGVDEVQLDVKVHDGEDGEVRKDVPLGANSTNPALYRNFKLVLKEVICKRWWCTCRGGRLTPLDASFMKCFFLLQTSSKTSMSMFFSKHRWNIASLSKNCDVLLDVLRFRWPGPTMPKMIFNITVI